FIEVVKVDPQTIDLHFAGPAPIEAFAKLPGVEIAESTRDAIRLRVQGSVDPVVKTAARYEVLDIESHEPSLEEVFLAFYGKSEEA
ncbi:MAG: hypothetical protein ACXVPR_00235, partial [Actinomycetota bacterium]